MHFLSNVYHVNKNEQPLSQYYSICNVCAYIPLTRHQLAIAMLSYIVIFISAEFIPMVLYRFECQSTEAISMDVKVNEQKYALLYDAI